ncbi:MAG TPA: transcription elongation factor GreA [Chloroflexi bacterium]|nr:transcription elongation factor GreA [Chloroflexota bacterium]
MTREMLEKLRAELKHKIEVERPALAARLKAAIEMGDLSENADYIAAKEDQSFLEGRIQELERLIRGAVIIEEGNGGRTGTVQLGSRVTVVEEGEEEPETFMIVGRVEANPREGKISDESPLGRALIGKKVGDTVRVEAPAGELIFKILDIA